MIRKAGTYRTELRENMRGGSGTVKIEHFWEPGSEMRAHNRMAARLTLPPGGSIGFHNHENEDEIFVIVKGQAEADDNGKITLLSAGDTLLTGNGAGHSIRNVGKEDLELVALISTY
ncbi:MAG: cupin domain-containing protein [Lentisphaerae bacterium]|nr:cupin domain-containing protein [Lentisphaerota bacterium]